MSGVMCSEVMTTLIFYFSFRNEIASCEEAAYESLPLKDAATLLFFTNKSELLTFAQKVNQHLTENYGY